MKRVVSTVVGNLALIIQVLILTAQPGYSDPVLPRTAHIVPRNPGVSGKSRLAEPALPSGQQDTNDRIRLLTEEPGESRREVVGIVCDNLREMPEAQKDRLFVQLPDGWQGARISSYSLEDLDAALPDKGQTDSTKQPASTDNIVGSLVVEGRQLVYFPPDEFNRTQEPERRDQITKQSDRRVLLKVSALLPNKKDAVNAEATITLRRPPVILIHGVNSSASMWSDPAEFGPELAEDLQEFGFQLDFLEHGQIDFDITSSAIQQALQFHGNGAVEYAAELLDKLISARLQLIRRRNPSFSIRRVDLVAHSYGGLVARWDLRLPHNDTLRVDSRQWYVHSANRPDKEALYRFDDAWFNRAPYRSGLPDPCVRKLITIAAPWRGTPIANYVNQMRVKSDPLRLYKAPIFYMPHFTLGKVVDQFLVSKDVSIQVATKVPSFEVTAVESPWLRFLNGFVEDGKAKPFLDDIAYAALAGDNNGFLDLSERRRKGARGIKDFNIDLFSWLDSGQTPSRFPYLALERRVGSAANYSDGLIPLWSALIPGGIIVGANHNSILTNPKTLDTVLCWLSSAALSTGKTLNARWGDPIESNVLDGTGGQKKRWVFAPGAMAPLPQSEIYGLVDGIGRIKPDVFADIHKVTIVPTHGGAAFSWKTPMEMESWVIVYEWRPINFAQWDYVQVRELREFAPVKDHRVTVTGLQPEIRYYFKVICDYVDALDGVLELQSDLKYFDPIQ